MPFIFDASAVIILLNQEPGHDFVKKYISQSMMSAVNLAEVITVLVSIGVPHTSATNIASELISEIIPFDTEQAAANAALRESTKPFGLSLGDRACLALAQIKQLPVITADKIWEKLTLPIEIMFAR